ncbi:unnamed protein product [Diamesa tonsa]
MRVCTFLLVITLVIALVVKDSTSRNAKMHKGVYPYDLQSAFNRKFLNMTIDLTNWMNKTRKNPPTLSPEIEAWLLKDLTNVMLIVKVKHVKSGNFLLDQSINVCQFSKWRNSLMTKNLFGEIDRNVDFKIQCPFKKGKYGVRSGPFSESFFPNFIKVEDPFETTIEIKSKINGRLEKIATISHQWEILEILIDN